MSAPAISPVDLGCKLGLAKGLDAAAVAVLSGHAMERAGVLRSDVSFDNQAAHYTFYEHLTALYFPCLLRTYLAAPFTFDDPQSYALYAYLLKSCLNTIAFTRFVREHPDELWDSFVRIVSTLAKVPPHIWQREPIEIHETALTCMLGSMVTLSQSLVIFSSKDPYVKLDDSLRADLRLILPRVNSDLFDGTDLMALALVSAPHSRSDLLRGMFMSGTAKYSWIHCEIRVVATAIEQLTCVNDGHEMEACGRCLSVRYCSRAHQKLDWKRHRELCFKPSW